ncbi:MAG: heat-shock protein Hsp90 [Succiniclasticum sp.]|jgi:ribosomal protein L12E/L44/L45/RPP1/RPP2|nr:heat-shock protein Hsp90 [Succiniclasticum sp.]MDY6346406.1 heat-shock protein Hsp90 [Succiniclasticum sp.]
MASARVLEKVQELLAAPSIYSGLKAVGTDGETAAAKKLLAELREDVQTIDEVLEFFCSDAGKSFFGAEKAAELEALAVKTKEAGGKHCFCPACQAGLAILAMEKEMLES